MRVRNRINEGNKRYEWLIFLTAIFWLVVVGFVFFVDPSNIKDLIIPNSYLVFMIFFSIASFLLLSILLLSAKLAAWWNLGVVLFIYLRINGLGNLFNFLLLLGLMITGDLYFRLINKKPPPDNVGV